MKPCTVNDNAQDDQSPKQDIYARITAKIVAALEDGVRPWVRPWNAEHAAGRVTRPLRQLGAASLCADLDLMLEPREDHAAYIANWLDVLKEDNRAIFTAASHAQRAADFINGLQPPSAG